MLKSDFCKYTLHFKFDVGTSRGVLKEKDTWYVKVWEDIQPNIVGIGECGPLKGLSIDDISDFENHLSQVSKHLTHSVTLRNEGPNNPLQWQVSLPSTFKHQLEQFPAILFAFETALLDLRNGGKRIIFPNEFALNNARIPINGLIWMGTKEFMLQQIEEKLQAGFSCLKMKIGAIDFQTEKEIIASIRSRYSENEIILRLDANGAFSAEDTLEKLKQLAIYHIHSIEQPIPQGNWDDMAKLCAETPIHIALDEELIGIYGEKKQALLEHIKPHYIILKPTLLGGFNQCDEWIELAEKQGIDWWITSALESNIGLNAICQYAFEKTAKNRNIPQGLGTGLLYHNNIPSPLTIENGNIRYDQSRSWGC